MEGNVRGENQRDPCWVMAVSSVKTGKKWRQNAGKNDIDMGAGEEHAFQEWLKSEKTRREYHLASYCRMVGVQFCINFGHLGIFWPYDL